MSTYLINVYEKYMRVMGICAQFGLYIQAYKIYKTGSSKGISFLFVYISLAACLSWCVYGMILKNPVLTWSNAIGTVGAVVLLCLSLHYYPG